MRKRTDESLAGKQITLQITLGALMNLIYRPVLGIAASVFALVLAAPQANAQSSEGTFQLASEVHWGRAVLEPGQYQIKISDVSSLGNVRQIILASNDKKTFFLGVMTPGDGSDKASYLQIENVNGMSFVHELESADLGAKFVFTAPKVRHQSISLGRPAEKTTVAVLIHPVQKSN